MPVAGVKAGPRELLSRRGRTIGPGGHLPREQPAASLGKEHLHTVMDEWQFRLSPAPAAAPLPEPPPNAE